MIACPIQTCRHPKSDVLATRGATRRRRCLACGHRWLTVEQHAIDLGALAADVVRRVKQAEVQR